VVTLRRSTNPFKRRSETVGGMSTPTGSVLVTSSGRIVGSTTPEVYAAGQVARARRSGGGGGGEGGSTVGGMSTTSGEVLVTPEGKYASVPERTQQQRAAILSARDKQTAKQFSGRVTEYSKTQFASKPDVTRYYVRGQETGRIETTPSGEQVAVVSQPSKFQFQRKESQATIQEQVAFSQTGADILESTQFSAPSLFEEEPMSRLPQSQVQRAGVEKGFYSVKDFFTGETALRKELLGERLTTSEKLSSFLTGSYVEAAAIKGGGRLQTGFVPITPLVSFGTTRLAFLGTSQRQTKTGEIITKVFFMTNKEKGIAKSISQVIGKGNKPIFVRTESVGKIIKTGIKVPTGKIVNIPTRTFASREVGAVIQRGNKFIQLGVGRVAPKVKRFGFEFTGKFKQQIVPFKTVSAGLTKGKYTISAGTLQSRLGTVKGLGIIKSISTPTVNVEIVGRASKISNVALKRLALQQTMKSVSTGVVKAPKINLASVIQPVVLTRVTQVKTIAITKPVSITKQITRQTTRQTTIPKLIQVQTQKQMQKVSSASLQKLSQSSITKEITKLNQPSITKERTKLAQPQRYVLKQSQKLKQVQRLIQVQRATSRQGLAFRIMPKIPKTPISLIPFFIKKKKETISPFGKFPVQLRRFGKFKTIGFGRTPEEAFTIGKEKASKTLGVTFKVLGITKQPKYIPGFKTKSTKEGTLFMELPKYRLSKRTEVKEIQFFKGMKGGKKRSYEIK